MSWSAGIGAESAALSSATFPTVPPMTVAQETFLRAYRKIEQYDDNRPFLPWLFTIARRLALNEIRRKNRKAEVSLSGPLA